MKKEDLKSYAECVTDIQAKCPEMTNRLIAGLIGIHESVFSKRMKGKNEPNIEGLIVINTIRDVVCSIAPRKKALKAGVPKDSFIRRVLDTTSRDGSPS